MHVHFDDRAFPETDDGVAHRVQPVGKLADVKCLEVHFAALEPEKKLGAVAPGQFGIFRKGVEIDGFGLRRRSSRCARFDLLPVEGFLHAFRDVDESCSAGVHDTGIFQHL